MTVFYIKIRKLIVLIYYTNYSKIYIKKVIEMKVLFVVNNYYIKGNGLSASARRTVEYLKKAGVDVKVLSAKSPYDDGIEPEFMLDTKYIPIFN